MKNEIIVPSMGESIAEATVGQIVAPAGSIVKADAELIELETDKVNQLLYAPQAGRVQYTVKSGDTVKIGQTIGSIEEVQEAPSAGVKEKASVLPSAQLTPVQRAARSTFPGDEQASFS